ncbi:MAG: ABC transporter permease [Pseudomonadota bacterium]
MLHRIRLPLLGLGCLTAAMLIGAESGDDLARLARAEPLLPPNGEHLLGTNAIGQDIFWRMLAGGRHTLLIAVPSALVAVLLGGLLGVLSAQRRGPVDTALVSIANAVDALPFYLWAAVMVVVLSPSIWAVPLTITGFYWIGVFRIVRMEALRLEATGFVQAARLLGASRFKILSQHLLPAVGYLLLVQTGLLVAAAVKVEVGISFLGLSGSDGISWGTMLAEASADLTLGHPWNAVGAGSALLCFLYLVNSITDRLQSALRERAHAR